MVDCPVNQREVEDCPHSRRLRLQVSHDRFTGRRRLTARLLQAAGLLAVSAKVNADELPNLNAVTPDLEPPPTVREPPGAGRRVEATTPGWNETGVHHTLYLPRGRRPDAGWPVVVEYAGNGGYRNRHGDVSDGTVEGCALGYGLSGGEGFLWVCLPFVEVPVAGVPRNCPNWWGDLTETKLYCIATVKEVCERHGGDPERVVLCGFSRGAIACNYVGLHDDAIAGLWRAFFCHSHYDGVRAWPYPGSDVASAATRLRRLRGREQWISHEGSVDETRAYLERSGVPVRATFAALPYVNHSAAWLLRDLPERRRAREWLARVVR